MTDVHDPIEALRTCVVIARREIYQHAQSRVVWMLLAVSGTLCAFSTHAAVKQLERRSAVFSELFAQHERRLSVSSGLTGWQTELTLRVIRPPEQRSTLVKGSDDLLPAYWDFGPAGVHFGPAPSDYRGVWHAAGEVDVEFIIRILLGLLAITLAVDSIAGERQNGALLALLGQAVRPDAVFAGKLLGAAFTLLVSVTAVLFIAFGAQTLTGAQSTSPLLPYFVGLGLLGLAYLLACFAGGVLLSTASRSYREASNAALVVWLLLSVVSTPAAATIAETVAPAMSQTALEHEAERVAAQITLKAQIEMGNRYVAMLGGVDRWSAESPKPTVERQAQVEAAMIWDGHVTSLRQQREELERKAADAARKQTRVNQILLLASPGSLLTTAAMQLAGTGNRMAERWRNAIVQHEAELQSQLFDVRPRLLMLVPAAEGTTPTREGRTIVAFNRRPLPLAASLRPFQTPRHALRDVVGDLLIPALLLTLYATGLTVAAVLAFRRLRF